MKNSSRAATERMRPEDVLGVIRDWYRFQEPWDPGVEPGIDLTFDSTIGQWRSVCDLVPTAPLGRALNESFCISASEKDWKHVLNSKGTLREVCQFISDSGAMRSPSGPMTIVGTECSLAGIFLALRSMLCEAGIPLAQAAPSTDLTPFIDEHLEQIITVAGKLEPGALPLTERRLSSLPSWLLLLTTVLVTFAATKQYLLAAAMMFVPIAYGLQIRRARRSFGSLIYFPGIRTMADLTKAIHSHRLDSATRHSRIEL